MAAYKLHLFRSCGFFARELVRCLDGVEKGSALRSLLPFDVDAVFSDLAALLGEACPPEKLREDGPCLMGLGPNDRERWRVARKTAVPSCRHDTPESEPLRSWLDVLLDCHDAPVLMPHIIALAWKYDLMLWDRQRPDGKVWSASSLSHIRDRICKKRFAQLKEIILQKMSGIRNIFTIEKTYEPRKCFGMDIHFGVASCAVVLKRCRAKKFPPLEERARELQSALLGALTPNEHLEYGGRAFEVISEDYCISFCLEAYNNNPSMTVHMDASAHGCREDTPGPVKVEPLHRPGMRILRRMFRELHPENDRECDIMKRMRLIRMQRHWPSAADRFAASIRMEKKLRAIGFLHYSCNRSKCGLCIEMCDFYLCSDGNSDDIVDALLFKDDVLSFLYPSINKIQPGGINPYSFLNPLTIPVCRRIAEDLKKVAWLLQHEPNAAELKEYITSFPLYRLGKEGEYNSRKCGEAYDREYLYAHRKQFCAFCSFVIEWLEEYEEWESDVCINIVGL